MRAAALVLVLLAVGAVGAAPAQGQLLPFAPGERLTYRASSARLGEIGTATLSVDGPVSVRGQAAYGLHFRIDSRVGPVKVLNVSESWLDARSMTSLRFHKRERHPLSEHVEQVEIFPLEQRWERGDGESGRTMHEAPLDELSFMYFLRTLTFEGSGTTRYDRHFDAARNPTLVRVVGRETLRTPAGTFATVLVEMRVRDSRYRGGGTIRINISEDARRLPVRIESSVPLAGRVVLTLESDTPGRTAAVALRDQRTP